MKDLGRLAFLMLLVLPVGCDSEPADVSVELVEPATATPRFFHGNCLAGWFVAAELRVRETERVDVFLDSLVFRVTDRGTGEELVSESLDRAAIEDRYGAAAGVLAGGTALLFEVGGPTPTRPVGPIAVSGEVSGRGEDGSPVRASFDLSTSVDVSEPEPPAIGACPPS